MAQLIIRDIEDKDVEPVVSLWRTCGLTRPWNDPLNDIAFARSTPTSTILTGWQEGGETPVAAVMAGHDGHRGWVYYLAVSPDLQEQGAGRQMMEAAENWLLEQGVWKTQLMVRTGNEKVLNFYEALGYNVSATQVLERWIDPSKRGDK